MKERPVLFSAPMVRAILAGTKTQTRRVVKPQPHDPADGIYDAPSMIHGTGSYTQDHMLADGFDGGTCPYGQPGDRLWVREAWMPVEFDTQQYRYRATNPSYAGKWRPSIHMPRVASRITLEIVSVRVERLNEISGSDCEAEGINRLSAPQTYFGLHEAYRDLWEQINGPGAWEDNPFVWVVEFKRVIQ